MANSGPRRLMDLKGESPLLAEVLEALSEREADAARVARVLARLEPRVESLEAAPSEQATAAPVAAVTATKLSKSKVILKLVLGATLLAIGAIGWLNHEQPTPQLRSAPVTPQAPLPVESVLEPLSTSAAAPVVISAEPAPIPTPIEHVPDPSQRASAPARAPARTRKPATTAPPTREPTAHAPAPSDSDMQAVQPPAAIVEAEPAPAPIAAPARKEVEQRPERARSASMPPRSELQLLTLARSVTPNDPAHALRLLTEHATHYPNGILTPEREVLAIDALRRLGKSAEAAARRERFRQSYPESFHLRK